MCGRCACSREPDTLRHACAYRDGRCRRVVKPPWIHDGANYRPSYNVSPRTNTPVLISGHYPHLRSFDFSSQDHVCQCCRYAGGQSAERVIQVMQWGLIPHWQKEGQKSLLLNNCRVDGMLEKPSFRMPARKGQRCVVLCDGFFEWDHSCCSKGGQPYFIYFAENGPTSEMVEIEETVPGEAKVGRGEGRLLTLAGLFECGKEDSTPFTYTIITVDADPTFSHVHHRMPAVLDGQEAIARWLDPARPTCDLIGGLVPSSCLQWHPVSTTVNSVKNKQPECIKEIKPPSRKQKSLFNYMNFDTKKQKLA